MLGKICFLEMISRRCQEDGEPVANFGNKDTAWHQVYEGIKAVINEMRNTFTAKPEFLEEQKKTDFLAQDYIKLQDVFVFPTLSCRTLKTKNGQLQEEKIINKEQLLKDKYSLIHGEEMSGKTALGKHLFLHLVEEMIGSRFVYRSRKNIRKTQ